jgi:hypothetical protein
MADKEPSKNGIREVSFLVEELKGASERLRQLAEELKAREEADAEMREKYQHFKRIVDAQLQIHIDRELPPLPEGKDLQTIAAEEGALPLEAFYPQLIERQKGSCSAK